MKKTTCMRIVFKTELLLQLWTGDLYISRMCTKDQYGGIGVTFFLSFTPFKFHNHFSSEFSSKMRKVNLSTFSCDTGFPPHDSTITMPDFKQMT